MSTSRRTGLGVPHLFRRPAEAKPTPLPEQEDLQPNDQPPESTNWGQRELPASRTQPVRKPRLRDRCTLYLDPEINQQLDFVAGVERRQRSEVVTELLRAHLPKYRITER